VPAIRMPIKGQPRPPSSLAARGPKLGLRATCCNDPKRLGGDVAID